MVPITICFGSYDAQKKFLLKTKIEKLDKLDFSDASDISHTLVEQGGQRKGGQSWIKVNIEQTGFYRVQYDDQLTAGLRYAIEAKQLSETDRFGSITINSFIYFSWSQDSQLIYYSSQCRYFG